MSFLEKLQKGMQSAPPPEPGPVPDEETRAPDMHQVEPPRQEAALLASYRTPPAKSSADDIMPGPPPARKRPRRRPQKLITAENIEEMTAAPAEPAAISEIEEINKTDGDPFAAKDNLPSAAQDNVLSAAKDKKTMFKKTKETDSKKGGWFSNEGQLTVDVYQTDSDLVVRSAIAGIKVEDLDVQIEDEVITIKGNRLDPSDERGDYFIEECYWGPFSRKIILPVEVDSGRADASMKDGILTIRIPKIQREKKKKVTIKG